MSKQIAIALGAISIFLIILAALFFWGPLRTFLPTSIETQVNRVLPDYFAVGRAGIAPPSTGTLPSGTPTQVGAASWTVAGRDGTVIAVQPFQGQYAAASGTPTQTNNGSATTPAQMPEGDVVLVGDSSEDAAYAITYFAHDQSFTLTLLKEPIGETRKAGEAELLSRLGIGEAEACRLRHSVLVPWWVNERYSGYNLDFSFCKGAPQF